MLLLSFCMMREFELITIDVSIIWLCFDFQIMVQFIRIYRQMSAKLRARGLADTDQQVLASMYSPSEHGKNNHIQLATYSCPRGAFGLYGYKYLYFCLPYICKASYECKTRSMPHTQTIEASQMTS